MPLRPLSASLISCLGTWVYLIDELWVDFLHIFILNRTLDIDLLYHPATQQAIDLICTNRQLLDYLSSFCLYGFYKASEFQSRRNELGVKIHHGSETVKSHNRNRDPS